MASGQVLVSVLAAAVAGAALGFLRWNFNPAKIFMGDGGAMFLGFLMATLGLKLRLNGASQGANWLVPILVLGVPIFDTVMVSISRSRRGLLPFATPGKDHTGHRLSNCGLRTRGAVLLMYAFGVMFGLLALGVSHLASWTAAGVVAVVAGVALIAVAVLERAPYERQEDKAKISFDAARFGLPRRSGRYQSPSPFNFALIRAVSRYTAPDKIGSRSSRVCGC